jgi:hypothetical protein
MKLRTAALGRGLVVTDETMPSGGSFAKAPYPLRITVLDVSL